MLSLQRQPDHAMSLKDLLEAHKSQNEHPDYKRPNSFADKAAGIFHTVVVPALNNIIETFLSAGYYCDRSQLLSTIEHGHPREHIFFSAGYKSCTMQVDAFPNYLTERFLFEITYSNRQNLTLALSLEEVDNHKIESFIEDCTSELIRNCH